jgi:signal transduction histidine kinase
MFNPKIIDRIGYAENRNGNNITRQPAPATTSMEEAEALLLLLETSVVKLNQPMAVVLGLSEHLLSQTEQETPLAKDLEIMVKELRHVNEVVRGLNLLTQYETNSRPH